MSALKHFASDRRRIVSRLCWPMPLNALTLPYAQIFEKFTYLILDIHRAL